MAGKRSPFVARLRNKCIAQRDEEHEHQDAKMYDFLCQMKGLKMDDNENGTNQPPPSPVKEIEQKDESGAQCSAQHQDGEVDALRIRLERASRRLEEIREEQRKGREIRAQRQRQQEIRDVTLAKRRALRPNRANEMLRTSGEDWPSPMEDLYNFVGTQKTSTE